MSRAELVVDARNATGECPVWHVGEQALYWVDIPARTLHRWSAEAGHATWQGDEMLACIAPRADAPGEWIAGMESGLFSLRPEAGGRLAATPLAGIQHAAPAMRFNDGRCDRQGRFVAGTMALDMAAALQVGCVYGIDLDAAAKANASKPRVRQLLDGFIVPNGLAFSPDGRTMYLSDSHPNVQAIWSFDYDIETGTPSNRRLFVDMKPLPGRPDGAAIDIDGCYWICGNDAGLVHRFTPEGRLDRSLEVPVRKPAMCAFGGPALDTLYVTSIRPAGDLADQPLAGGLFALRPGTQGIEEPRFGPTPSSV